MFYRYTTLVATVLLLSYTGGNDAVAQCSTSNATSCQCRTSGQSNCDLLPDITISWKALRDYAGGPNEYPQNDPSNPGRLRVTGSTPNIGYGPLNVRGVDQNGYRWFLCGTDTISIYDPNSSIDYTNSSCPDMKQLILQRIYHKNNGAMTFTERMAGTMTYHPTHGHNHVDDWATFTLRVEVPGESNPLNWPIVGDGAKVGFCLMDYYPCTSSSASGHCRTSQEYNSGTALNSQSNYPNYGLGGGSYNCSQITQGISVGYTDVYSESLDGMWINIPPNTCNGDYWVVMEVDPRNNFIEENENNNWTAVPVTLTQQLPSAVDFASITASTATTICAGTPIELTATAGTSYLWSTGETTRTITPTQSGTYGCTVTSTCGTDAADPVTVEVVEVQEPLGTGDVIEGAGQAVLEATGTDIRWYDQAVGGNMVGSGNQFTTPVISETTSYWAEDRFAQTAASQFVGKSTNSGGGAYNTLDQYLIFDALDAFMLKSVKVYAQSAGNRTFQVLNSTGGLVVETTRNVPAGESRVQLDLFVPAGTDYRLKLTTGFIDMYRNNGGVSFPYSIGGLVNITNSSAGTTYYYYCYDWEVKRPDIVCNSARTEVVATVHDGVRLDLKVALEGPYHSDNGLMHDSLRVLGLIPGTEPFTAAGFQHAGSGGGETISGGVLSITGNDAVVDWILIELRDPTQPSQIVATTSALLLRSGQVVSASGGEVRFPVAQGNYHVAVRHRNHLGCMTAGPIAFGTAATLLDLRSAGTAAWGSGARKDIGGVQALFMGNVLGDQTVKYTGQDNDRDPILQTIGGTVPTSVVVGYLTADTNLDGSVKYTGQANDRDPILSNIGGVVPTQVRNEQLP